MRPPTYALGASSSCPVVPSRRFRATRCGCSSLNRTSAPPEGPAVAAGGNPRASEDGLRTLTHLAGGETRCSINSGLRGRGVFCDPEAGSRLRGSFLTLPLHRAIIVDGNPTKGDAAGNAEVFLRNTMRAAGIPDPPAQLMSYAADVSVPHDFRLGALLLYLTSRGGDFWQCYGSTLPAKDAMAPLVAFSEAEAQALGCDNLLQLWETQRSRVPLARDEWREQAGVACGSEDEAMWALASIASRDFGSAGLLGWPDLKLMLPAVDMVNCDVTPNAQLNLDRVKGTASIVPLPGGEWRDGDNEVLISYGKGKANEEMMSSYGFALPGNPNDRVEDLPADVLAPLFAPLLLRAADVEPSALSRFKGLEDVGGRQRGKGAAGVEKRRTMCALASVTKLCEGSALGREVTRDEWLDQAARATQAAEIIAAGCSGDSGVVGEEGSLSPRMQAALGYRKEKQLLREQACACLRTYAEWISARMCA